MQAAAITPHRPPDARKLKAWKLTLGEETDMRKATELALEALSRSFSAADVMTIEQCLVRASTREQATTALKTFDLIPYPISGPILGYFERDGCDVKTLGPEMVISDSTGLMDLPRLFIERPVYFVLRSNRICGIVHLSDLNSPLAKLPLYVLYQAVESELVPVLNTTLREEDVRSAVQPGRFGVLLKARTRRISDNIDLGWAQGLLFSELLDLAVRLGVLQVPGDQQKVLVDLRNRVAHADQNLITSSEDVKKLLEAHRAIEDLTTMLQALPSTPDR